jgi:hypothetical protein
MNKAYIILAHKNESQVSRLVDRLNDGHSQFYLHVDLQADFGPFELLFSANPKVTLVERVKTPWAEFGIVQATLNALREIRDSGLIFDRIILLSGQDYPIKTNAAIDHYLSQSPFSIFMEHYPLPNYRKWALGGGLFRVDKYFFGLAPASRYAAKAVNFLGMLIPSWRRRPPQGMLPLAGSQWWSIDTDALHYLLDFVKLHPEYIQYHKNTFAADEVFFQMILLNSRDTQLLAKISNDHLRLMHWQGTTAAHPELLGPQDMPGINNSTALFARKFDSQADSTTLNLLDERLNSNP